MSDSKVVLVTGATGNQGSAVIDALIAKASSSSQLTILGVTRNPNSPGAQKLAAKSPLIKLLKGDLSDPAPLFTSAREITKQPVWGVYSVTVFDGKGGVEAEEKQGRALIDSAIANDVKFFVQSSVDRGGDEKSWNSPTDVPHFISKHNIELYLREKAAGTGMSWTILRPVAFLDNLKNGFSDRVFLAALQNELGPTKPLQWVAVRDIGIFAANAFMSPEAPEYKNQAIGLAGDELTVQQMVDVFAKTGNQVKPTFGFLGSALLMALKEIGIMTRWFGREGYGADVEKNKRMNPAMMNMETWIKSDESAFSKK